MKNIKTNLLKTMLIPLSILSPPLKAEGFSDTLTKLDESKWSVSDGWQNGYPFYNDWKDSQVKFNNKGMKIKLSGKKENGENKFSGGELRSNDFFGYGCFEVEMKAVKSPGVITSFFLFSGPYDKPKYGNGQHNEIDIEFLGSNTNMVQFNFWTDDDDYSRSHETLVFLDFDASESFNKYSIYWGEDKIEWYINDKLMLKVKNSIYDPTPTIESSELRVMANLWAVNPDLSNWAGEFDINKKNKRVARYKNFKFTPLESCG